MVAVLADISVFHWHAELGRRTIMGPSLDMESDILRGQKRSVLTEGR